MKKVKSRLGEVRKNKESLGGYEMKIVEYNEYNNIWVEFQDEHRARIHTKYCHFESGSVKNPYHPTIFEIGYFGEGKYSCKTHEEIYEVWRRMLARCYDAYVMNRQPTYIDCYVCEEWHNFQNFAKWYEENYYECNGETLELDKDILIKGNKIYSPQTCIFAPNRINCLFVNMKDAKHRGRYPIGIVKDGNKLRTRCNIVVDGKMKNIELGRFNLDEVELAFTAYKIFKENYIKQVADEYKDLIPEKLYDAMYEYEVEITD